MPPAHPWRVQGRVRLSTLNNLRWLAVAGQSAAIVIVNFVLGFDLPLLLSVLCITASALANIGLAVIYPAAKRLSNREATVLLTYDILQLAALLFLTGGIENPFSLLFLAPVVIAAATLDVASTLFLAGVSFAAISFLANLHFPLPWTEGEEINLPPLYVAGIWSSLLLGIGFTSIYAWRIAGETARMSQALAATQLALAREHRLASLGALAAAAAHELGTPLGTIALVAHELDREAPKDSPLAEDFRLLRAEADRCRAILTRLSQPEEAVLGTIERLPLGALLDDIAAPHRDLDVAITVDVPSGGTPKVWRVPELLHGLGNLIENAAEFANREVHIQARWDTESLTVSVLDDGPGFAAEIAERIGEPYVTSRPRKRPSEGDGAALSDEEGMGLGFFIAKTLLEHTGARVGALNRPEGGAVVTVVWPRGAVDGDDPPRQEFWL